MSNWSTPCSDQDISSHFQICLCKLNRWWAKNLTQILQHLNLHFLPMFCHFSCLSLSLSLCHMYSPSYSHSVRPDWAIYWTLGNFSKPLATINLPNSLTFLGNFCKGVKIYHFSSDIIFGELYRYLAIFFRSHCSHSITQTISLSPSADIDSSVNRFTKILPLLQKLRLMQFWVYINNFYAIGRICNVSTDWLLKNNLAVWSHWQTLSQTSRDEWIIIHKCTTQIFLGTHTLRTQ